MTTTVSVSEAKMILDDLVAKAFRGDEVVIEDGLRGRFRLERVARVEPKPLRQRIPGLHRGLVQVAPDFDADIDPSVHPLFAEWREENWSIRDNATPEQ